MPSPSDSGSDPVRDRVRAIVELTAELEVGNKTALRLTRSVEDLTKRVEAKDQTYHRVLSELRAIVVVIFLLLFVNLFAVARLQAVANSNRDLNRSNSRLLKDIEDATGSQAQARSQAAIQEIERDLDQRFRDALNEERANGAVGPAPAQTPTAGTTTPPTTTTTTTTISHGQAMSPTSSTTTTTRTTPTSVPTTVPTTTAAPAPTTTTRPPTTTTTACLVAITGRCVA